MFYLTPIFELKNPDTIIIQNQYYPSGLKEIDIYNYYIKNKNYIIKECNSRNVMFFIVPYINDTVIIRKTNKGQDFIKLNKINYDKYNSGRMISIHSNLNRTDNIGIIDIDYSKDFKICKESVILIYNYLKELNKFKDIKIKYTGKNSFHIITYFNSNLNIDKIREYLFNILTKNNNINNNFYIYPDRSGFDKPRIDLSSNKEYGGFITAGSLSIIGLISKYIKLSEVLYFNKNSCKII